MIRAHGLSWQRNLLLCGMVAVGIGLVAGLWLYARLYKEYYVLRFEQLEIDLCVSRHRRRTHRGCGQVAQFRQGSPPHHPDGAELRVHDGWDSCLKHERSNAV